MPNFNLLSACIFLLIGLSPTECRLPVACSLQKPVVQTCKGRGLDCLLPCDCKSHGRGLTQTGLSSKLSRLHPRSGDATGASRFFPTLPPGLGRGGGAGVPSAVPRESEARQGIPATPPSEPRSLRLPRCSCAGKDPGGSERADGRAGLRPEAAVRGARQRGLRTRLDPRHPARLVAPAASAKCRELAAARTGGSGRAAGAGRARRGGAGLALTDGRAAAESACSPS